MANKPARPSMSRPKAPHKTVKPAKRRLTPNQAEYNRELKNLRARIRRAEEKTGASFEELREGLTKRPERITKSSIAKLKEIKAARLYSESDYARKGDPKGRQFAKWAKRVAKGLNPKTGKKLKKGEKKAAANKLVSELRSAGPVNRPAKIPEKVVLEPTKPVIEVAEPVSDITPSIEPEPEVTYEPDINEPLRVMEAYRNKEGNIEWVDQWGEIHESDPTSTTDQVIPIPQGDDVILKNLSELPKFMVEDYYPELMSNWMKLQGQTPLVETLPKGPDFTSVYIDIVGDRLGDYYRTKAFSEEFKEVLHKIQGVIGDEALYQMLTQKQFLNFDNIIEGIDYTTGNPYMPVIRYMHSIINQMEKMPGVDKEIIESLRERIGYEEESGYVDGYEEDD